MPSDKLYHKMLPQRSNSKDCCCRAQFSDILQSGSKLATSVGISELMEGTVKAV